MRYLLALSIVLNLAGCYSDHSLATLEQAVFDERLLGNWLFPGSEDGSDVTEIVVARFNEKEYVAAPAHEFSPKEGIRFFVTEIDGQRFLNAQDLTPDLERRGYMFARYSFRNDDEALLEVPNIDAVPHQVASSNELVEAFRTGTKTQGFFNDKPSVLRRIRKD